MVCSCTIPSNCVWLQIIFCSCVKETVLFSFLRSLLRENGRSLRFPKIFLKKQTRWMIKQLLNSVITKYRDLSVSRRSIICLSLRLRQIIVLLATDKSRYFAQPRPTIVNCVYNLRASEPWQRAMQSIEDSLKIVQWCECVRDVNEYGIIVVNCAATLV